jgi:phospholipid/cholesterol/gamma-HCH transport system substrate-binding protein
VIGTVRSLQQKFAQLSGADDAVTVDQSGQTVGAPAAHLCIPVPGKDC